MVGRNEIRVKCFGRRCGSVDREFEVVFEHKYIVQKSREMKVFLLFVWREMIYRIRKLKAVIFIA